MGTYFHVSSEIQAAADGLQTLYLMNPNYVPYTDNNQHFVVPHAPPPNQHFVGIPLMPANNSDDPNRASLLATQEFSALHGMAAASRVHYNLWGPADHTASSSGGGAEMGFRGPTHQQGLSLSLSSQQTAYRSVSGEHDVVGNSPSSVSAVSNGISGMQSVILGSKYLKAAQEILDEVVNVGKGIIKVEETKEKMKMMNKESTGMIGDHVPNPGEGSSKQGITELTTAQRQELQMKKAKLVSMLDEVEQRYREYHHQMQIVVSSFEQAAGFGSARSYTALALQTISKQFRCLKDAICSQIKATSKSLGEDDCLGAKAEGSRLKYVDQQLRQQRALQQLGMLQHNAWRPQRGLPERAVSVLRAWLFDHFLHPYPKDADKIMLAKQTGLTRSQVSNWFINARVRLWKPMVEEMYSEEIKEHEQNGSQDNNNNRRESKSGSTTKPENVSPTAGISNSSVSAASHMVGSNIQAHSGFNLVGLSDDMQLRSPKQPRSSEMHNSPHNILSMDIDMDMKPDDSKFVKERAPHGTKDGYSFVNGSYSVGDYGRFNPEELAAPRFHGNGVSLTLGLPQTYLSPQNIQMAGRSLEMGSSETDFCVVNNTPQPSHSNTAGYGNNIDIQSRKRFAAQLLPDFVA